MNVKNFPIEPSRDKRAVQICAVMWVNAYIYDDADDCKSKSQPVSRISEKPIHTWV